MMILACGSIGKPTLVQALVTETAVERFDVGVLIGLAGFDQEQLDTTSMCPCQHGPAAELLAVVGGVRLWQATRLRQLVVPEPTLF